MSNEKTKLPPELVEKMSQHVDLYNNKGQIDHDLSWKRAEQCAQIAVEYTMSETSRLVKVWNTVTEQRNELLEFVIEVMETTTDKIRYDKAKQLINKIDGK